MNTEAKRQRLVMLRGEVAARKTAQATTEKAQREERICALHTTEEIFAVHQEAKAEQEARAVRAAEEILAARLSALASFSPR